MTLYTLDIFNKFALTQEMIVIQELRFHILGGDVDGTLPLLNYVINSSSNNVLRLKEEVCNMKPFIMNITSQTVYIDYRVIIRSIG